MRFLVRPVTVFWPFHIWSSEPGDSDNITSVQLAKNPVFHARTKHIEVLYHLVHMQVLSGEVELQYVRTDQ